MPTKLCNKHPFETTISFETTFSESYQQTTQRGAYGSWTGQVGVSRVEGPMLVRV